MATLIIMANNMKLKKGSKEAKAFMAKLRAAKGKPKKKVAGWNKGGTYIIESGEGKPKNANKVIKLFILLSMFFIQ